MDIQLRDDEGLRELALFAGAGGGILGGKLLGWRTVCAVERDAYAASVLVSRQNDGCLEAFPVWDDVRTFDGRPWRGIVDVISGGFPCQDISTAGKGAGITGERSGLWKEFARIIGEVRPRFVFVENSPALTSRGLGTVLGDLAALGYDAQWGVLGAVDSGAPHKRERIWIVAYAADDRIGRWEQQQECSESARDVAYANEELQYRPWEEWASRRGEPSDSSFGEDVPNSDGLRELQPGRRWQKKRERVGDFCENVPDPNSPGREEQRSTEPEIEEHATTECRGWWEAEPGMGRVVDGVANRMDRLSCLGNGQVPAVAALAWRTLSGRRA